MNSMMKSALVWIGIIVLVLLALKQIPQNSKVNDIAFSQFYTEGVEGKYRSVTLTGQDVEGVYKMAVKGPKGEMIDRFKTVAPPMQDLGKSILSWKQEGQLDEFRAAKPSENNFMYMLVFWGPLLVFVVLWFVFMRQAQMGGNKALSFGKARARGLNTSARRVTFADVAGCNEAKEELQEIVEFLKDPAKFVKLGGKIPRGVLLMGPPGTGKTLLARAISGEAKVQFFSISGSDFVEMFVGVGASRVRDLFEQGKKNAPCIIFIDEIDAVGRHRGAGLGGGHDEREQTLNQLLVEMDGFEGNEGVILIAATNRPDVLDPALLRPGRFDRRVVVDRPDLKGRFEILKVHTADKIPLSPDVDLEVIARGTPGFAGADLANLCNEAALIATRLGADSITARDFAHAMDKIVLGDPRETLLDPEEKRRVAVHESGHAVVAHFTKDAESLRRVSILPRGFALGATQQSAAPDRHLATQRHLEAKLAVLMGGYAAESLLWGNVSSGSENDLRVATDLAFKMVAHYGMSERVGPMFHEQRIEHPFLGQKLATDGGISDATAHAIEDEARKILAEALTAAKETIQRHRPVLDRLVAALLERETLEKCDLEVVMAEPAEERERPSHAA